MELDRLCPAMSGLGSVTVAVADHVQAWVMTAAEGDPVEDVVWMVRGQWVTLSLRAAVELVSTPFEI